jgi:predicted GNAT superfamily acetyltransferase
LVPNYLPCRRTNFVQAAYVEAAVYINRTLGSDRAYWMLLREQVPGAVIDRILRGDPACVRRKDRRYATRRATVREPEVAPATTERRKDPLTSQRVDVALVFDAMLGRDSATEYLRDNAIPVWVLERVFHSGNRRPVPALVPE